MHNIDALSAAHRLRRLWTLVISRDDELMTFGPYLHEEDAVEAASRIRAAAAEAAEGLKVSVHPTVPPTSPLYVGGASIWYQLSLAMDEPEGEATS